jgi:hypothetical protein
MSDSSILPVFGREAMLFLLVSFLLLICAEIGYFMGLRVFREHDAAHRALIGSYANVVFGLLALLLGFTFALAAGRYDNRRELVVQQANAIGTTYLRASLLPESNRDTSRRLLREYVDLLLKETNRDFTVSVQQSAMIQRDLWHQAELASMVNSGPLMAGYVTSLNEMIDCESTRLAADRAAIPGAIWLLLTLVAIVTFWATGYGSGALGKRAHFLTIGLPVLIALVITLINDLNRPHEGFIRIDHTNLKEIRSSMQ